jgi:signal peptide peptidase SppA
MSYPRIAQKLYGEPWAITAEAHAGMQRVFEDHMRGDTSRHEVYAPMNRFSAAALSLDPPRNLTSKVYRRGQLAYVPVHGIIGKGLSAMEQMCGGYSIDQLGRDVDEVNADMSVKRVLFDFDSPGGQISGVPEAARLIANCVKQTFGVTAGQSDSAAYWLMSQCGFIYCTESSEVGSIGVYLAIYDKTEMLAKQGIKLQLIKAGKHKAMGLPGNPLTEEEIQMLQDQVNQIYASFTGDIKAKRPKISADTMQGQAFLGKRIVENHLADALVTSLGDLVARLS